MGGCGMQVNDRPLKERRNGEEKISSPHQFDSIVMRVLHRPQAFSRCARVAGLPCSGVEDLRVCFHEETQVAVSPQGIVDHA